MDAVIFLEPGERGIEKRIAAQTWRTIRDLFEHLTGLGELPRLVMSARSEKRDSFPTQRLRA